MDDLDRQIREAAAELELEGSGDDAREADEAGAVTSDESEVALSPEQHEEVLPEPVEPAQEQAIEPAPTSWGAKTAAEWAKLPEGIRKEILKREGDIAKGFQQHSERRRQLDELTSAFEPIRQELSLSQVSPAQFVQRAVAIDQAMRKDPVGAIKWLAQTYGADLSALAPEQPKPGLSPDLHPDITSQFSTIEQRFAEIQRQNQMAEERWRAQDQARQQAEIDAFLADPEHKYANERIVGEEMANSVIQDMRVFLTTDKDLRKAYKKAILVNEGARAAIETEAAAKRAAEARRRPAKVTPSTAPVHVDRKSTLDQQIRASMDELKASGVLS